MKADTPVAWHDRVVADIDIPADLVAAKREFYAAERRLAEMRDADPQDWQAQQQHLSDLAVRIYQHAAFAGRDPVARLELDTAASKAARTTLD